VVIGSAVGYFGRSSLCFELLGTWASSSIKQLKEMDGTAQLGWAGPFVELPVAARWALAISGVPGSASRL